MAAADYLKEVGGTDTFSESVYEFLKKEDNLPTSVPAAIVRRASRKSSSAVYDFAEESQHAQEEEEADETVTSEERGARDGTADVNVSSPKVGRVSAPMGALLGLAQQLENMWKEEGAKGWDNNGDSRWEGEDADNFRDVGVDLNAGPGEVLSCRDSAESGAGQHERRSESALHRRRAFDFSS